ncbi:hypothetical protein [Companilactobacillus insicii]|uniref:hypothetical protein n=1 Tax=Companilactobacillus insicii TaxID=1732567 RepID=UPI000F7708C6|nr:hypothetical protein [Companilactobacillus insicii]
MKKFILFIIASIISFFVLININTTNVQASMYSDSDGINYAPKGMPLGTLSNNDMFVQGAHSGNGAVVSNGSSLKLTQRGQYNQVSSVWSNKALGNYIDTGKKQTFSLWLYFGVSLYHTQGLALVLQNDPRGTSAISMSGNSIAGGQTLGVWGSDVPNKATPADVANSAIKNSWALEFDSTINGYSDYENVVQNHKGTAGNSLDSFQFYNGENRKIVDEHTAWAYPGLASTYLNIAAPTSSKKYYEMVHNDINEDSLSYANSAQLAWHHLKVIYTPPTDSDPDDAKLEYIYNDTSLTGFSQNLLSGQHYLDTTVPLKLSNLGVKKGDPLLFGLTGANGADLDHSQTGIAVFETMPSIVDADTNAYIVDKTTKSKVSSKTDPMPSDVQALSDTKVVHPKDNLQFNYMVRYNSGKKDMMPLSDKIYLPSNVTFTKDSNGNVGQVVYENGDHEDIPYSDINSDGTQLNCTLKQQLNTTQSTARVELNATANNVPDGSSGMTVGVSPVTFESDNYIGHDEAPKFQIEAPQDNLTITKTSTDPVKLSVGKTTNLTGTMKFDKQSTIDNDDMNIYVSVDGNSSTVQKDTNSSNGNFSIPFSSEDVGTHKITVQVVDNNYVSSSGIKDTIASNMLTYTVNVQDISLAASGDTSPIIVLNNTSVELPTIDINYVGGSSTDVTPLTASYSISNPSYNNGDPITITPKTLNEVTGWPTSEVHLNIDAAEGSKDGLRIGQNTVKVAFKDQNGHVSNKLTYVINVQDKNPILSYGDGNDGNITAMGTDDNISFPINATYENNLSFAPSDLTMHVTVDGNDIADLPKSTDDTSTISYDVTKTLTQAALGITGQTAPMHTVTFTVTDPYGRESNKLTYNVKMIYKSANLTYKSDYSFGSFNQSPEARLVKRTSEWNVAVNTIDSPYKLTASAGELTTTDLVNNHTLAGELVYVDPKNNDQLSTMNQPVTLSQSDKDATNSYSISNVWKPNQGILLQVDPNAASGSYSGSIKWDLTDSID